jgi:hypothetical protein
MNSKPNRKRKTKQADNATSIMTRWSQPSLPTGRSTSLSTYSGMAREIARIRKNLNTEQKFLDQVSVASNVASDTNLVVAITPPAQGDTSSTRDGNSIKVIRCDFRMTYLFGINGFASTDLQNNQIFQWYLFRWKKTPTSSGSTPPAIGDIFNLDSSGTNYSTQSLMNVNTNQNYQLMCNGTVECEPKVYANDGTGPYVANERKLVEIVHNCEFHQYFSSTTAASITDNLMFMVFLASNTGNSSASSNMTLSFRQWYVDN